jgi:uncharacterized protein YjbJ (UPF0337 family)
VVSGQVTGDAFAVRRKWQIPKYEEDEMSLIPRVGYKNAVGLADKFVGLGKEVVGEIVDRPRLIKAGEEQQSKGSEKLKALRAQSKADAHEAKARTHEAKQRTAERAKA